MKCAEGERKKKVHCLLLHPSVLKVQVESYSLRSACVCRERGGVLGREGRKGSEKEGVERWKRGERGRTLGDLS